MNTTIPPPSPEQALQFVTILHAGLPAAEAILYFTDSDDPQYIAAVTQRWLRSREVKRATASIMGKSWQDMSTDDQMKFALDRHYKQLSTLLAFTNYIEANAGEKTKMDAARTALEAKAAGTSGQLGAMDQFYADLKAGKLRLAGSQLGSPARLQ